jgi:glutamyl-tRNA reductase
MFHVGTGLDSQILVILKLFQIRSSFTQSKVIGLANNFMERISERLFRRVKK